MTDKPVSAETRPEDYMSLVGEAIDEITARFPEWRPSEAQLGFAAAVAKLALEKTRPTIEPSEEYVEAVAKAAIAVALDEAERVVRSFTTIGDHNREGAISVMRGERDEEWLVAKAIIAVPRPDPILPAGEVGELVEYLRWYAHDVAPEGKEPHPRFLEAADLLTRQQAVMDETAQSIGAMRAVLHYLFETSEDEHVSRKAKEGFEIAQAALTSCETIRGKGNSADG